MTLKKNAIYYNYINKRSGFVKNRQEILENSGKSC